MCDACVVSHKMMTYNLQYLLPLYQLLSPTDIPPLVNDQTMQQESMEWIHSDTYSQMIYSCMVCGFTSNDDITYIIPCLYISSSLHQIFNHWEMTTYCSIYQWSISTLIHFTHNIFMCDVCMVSYPTMTSITLFFASIWAPLSNRYSTTGRWPWSAAWLNGVFSLWYISHIIYSCVTYVWFHIKLWHHLHYSLPVY